MELKNLYTIIKILETGSFQNAANELNYAQSTITFQVKQLETELGIKIFKKKQNRMVLTEDGKEVLPFIEKVIDSVDMLLSYKIGPNLTKGSLKIALPETLVTYKIQPVLKAFKEQAPNVKLYLQVLNCYSIYDQLLNGNIDIAIHYDVKKYPQNVEVIELEKYPLVMVASSCVDDTTADLVTPNQQKSVCHIQNDPNALYLKILDHYLREKKISLETGMEVWSIEAIKKSVMSNLGIAYLPRFTVADELENGVFRECPMDISGEMTALCAYPANKKNNPTISLFLELLYKEFDL